jgi:hypothetical protein
MGRTRTERLRCAVDALPRPAREAMLDGVREDTIIAGAYVGGRGSGSCPMVAVHRRGVRTDANRFARAWDQFCGVAQGQSRIVSARELGTLEAMLQASLLADEHVDLRAAVAEHRALRRGRHARDAMDLGAVRAEHQALARARRAREAAATGIGWLRDADAVSPARSPLPAAPAGDGRVAARAGAPAPAHG